MPFIPPNPIYLPHKYIDVRNEHVDHVAWRAFEKTHAHGGMTTLQYTKSKVRIYFSDERDVVLFKLFCDIG